MGEGTSSFFEYLSNNSEGMPRILDFPEVESPNVDLPTITTDLSTIPDDVLARNISVYSGYNAAAENAAGMFAAAEEATKQELNHIRRSVFMEKRDETEFKNALKDHKNYFVEEDDRVLDAESRYQIMKQNHIMFKSRSNSYEKMLLLYMGERKHRREYAINGKSHEREY